MAKNDEKDSFTMFLNDMGRKPLLTSEEERNLCYLIDQGNLEARNEMIVRNLGLVVSIAKIYAKDKSMTGILEISDMVQLGTEGLIHSLKKYNHNRGLKFSTYSTWWIKQSIKKGISDTSRTIYLPAHVGIKLKRYKSAALHLETELRRKPKDYEVAYLLGVPLNKIQTIISATEHPRSLDELIGSSSDTTTTLGDTLTDPNPERYNPEKTTQQRELRRRVQSSLSTLDDRQEAIIDDRFGLTDGVPQTLAQIGKRYGVTRERIRQVEAKAKKKLKSKFEYNHIKDFY